jgi:hypothetical protein
MNDFPRIFQRNKCFKFNLESVQFAELPDSVMSCFDQFCKNIDDKLGESSDKIHDDLKKIDSENDRSFGGLETLGVFLPPEYPSQNANILVCPKRIEQVANNQYDFFYTAIKIHEYAHAVMCPILYTLKDKSDHADPFYTFIEESLATAAMLLEMKEHQLYPQLEHFAASQMVQYRYGLVLIQRFKKSQITRLMCIWKNTKSTSLWHSALNVFMESLIEDRPKVTIANLEKIDEMNVLIQNLDISDHKLSLLDVSNPSTYKKIGALAKLYS